ncbi:hypothetical protein K493DRAFT_351900 [Basidiobolus meristosporus CBS 931.73]|uniref:Uncharacterized protein n=1 Tax=Basidiobolus meristosporus CBS 931.73 TaxID=1314790 RepID=A0A1Y1YBE7_9FUNG|nr:hypothetical protein K493DRAFT_351900 [Basidiobolus meristosporus CBS 931.73]|eukprot:ORX95086.1 hypothetical protein K493DRAFT_351900 [Basidiobolus meristosporus CBS 931.73]
MRPSPDPSPITHPQPSPFPKTVFSGESYLRVSGIPSTGNFEGDFEQGRWDLDARLRKMTHWMSDFPELRTGPRPINGLPPPIAVLDASKQ